MNSVTKSAPQQQPETTTKKKFGKNLNKLTKPPQPTSNTGTKPNANSRNGLLLLSTKRQSSGNNAASAGGILASKSSSQATTRPLPSLGLQNQSSTSTHEALLGAVVGASRAETQQPDAWGVADKQRSSNSELNQTPSGEHNGEVESHGQKSFSETNQHTTSHDHKTNDHDSVDLVTKEASNSNWSEYGGRNLASNGGGTLYVPDGAVSDDDQKAAMTRMARERAEKRRAEEEARQSDQRQRAAQRLRELDEKMGAAEGTGSRGPQKVRSLYDPSKPNKSHSTTNSGTENQVEGAETTNLLQNGRSNSGSYSPDPNSFSDTRESYGRQPMIQLSSYDDRDRGERGSSTGPRMLFDPKSGSMIAVPSRDESTLTSRGRKERSKKGKNSRERDLKSDSKQESDGLKNGRKGKREKKSSVESASPAKVESKKGKNSSRRRLPRTCGVLYSRDNKGNLVCSDGCEGDLGYGAHSVPGGRLKNSDAYSKFLGNQKQVQQGDMGMYESRLDKSFESDSLQVGGSEEVALQTGFNVPESAEVRFDWVKPSDKIELITGVDDSPTLQATAKAWAPSQAALAAAAARVESGSSRENAVPPTSVDSFDADEGEEDDDGPFGLGFDPTLNMDSVMQSPSAEPASGLDAVDLTSLSLQPAYQGATNTNHIFAFGTGDTWGASNSSGGNDNWGVPSATGNSPAFLSLSAGNAWGGVPGLSGTSLGSSSLNGDPARSPGD